MDSPQSESSGEGQKAEENGAQGELQRGDIRAAGDAFGASTGGGGAQHGGNARSAENLQPAGSRR